MTTCHTKMTNTDNIINTLKLFRELSSEEKNHPDLIKEKKSILYAATLLDNADHVVVGLCLDILENFVANDLNHTFLMSTFGIYEALETLTIKIRDKNEKLCRRAEEITEILRNSSPPAYNTRNRTKTSNKKHQLFLLYLDDLNQGNIQSLEQILLKIRGIISYLVDLEMKRCTIRICPKTTIKEVIEKIYNKSSMKALVVTKNKEKGIEEYFDTLEQSNEISFLEYPEEKYSPKGTAVSIAARNLVENGNNLLKSVKNFWAESFYW